MNRSGTLAGGEGARERGWRNDWGSRQASGRQADRGECGVVMAVTCYETEAAACSLSTRIATTRRVGGAGHAIELLEREMRE